MVRPQKLKKNDYGCSGFCRRCGREHGLPIDPAHYACLTLMAELESKKRIDLSQPDRKANPRFSTDYLLGDARGKMFGVMIAAKPDGVTVVLRAFSGQYNGAWHVPGWVVPVFDLEAFHRIHDYEEKKIKELGRRINGQKARSPQQRELIALRKQLSQKLMKEIHNLYRLQSYSGAVAGLREIFPPDMGIPTGTGDCCAPKLLQHAAVHGLVPLSIAEFYWGRQNKSGSRQHGEFYPSCRTKCYPILGFMLCNRADSI